MKKMNNKGFALVETLIVSTFVVGIFTLLYINFYPMIGEYEKRETYDDIDSVYNTYLVKRMIEKEPLPKSPTSEEEQNRQIWNNKTESGRNKIECSMFIEQFEYCTQLIEQLDIESIYITLYDMSHRKIFQSQLGSEGEVGLFEYVQYLPNTPKNNGNFLYRVIVQYKTSVVGESEEKKREVYHYGTMGVYKPQKTHS